MENRALLKAWAKGAKLGEANVWSKIRTWDVAGGKVKLASSWPIHGLPHSINIVCPETPNLLAISFWVNPLLVLNSLSLIFVSSREIIKETLISLVVKSRKTL